MNYDWTVVNEGCGCSIKSFTMKITLNGINNHVFYIKTCCNLHGGKTKIYDDDPYECLGYKTNQLKKLIIKSVEPCGCIAFHSDNNISIKKTCFSCKNIEHCNNFNIYNQYLTVADNLYNLNNNTDNWYLKVYITHIIDIMNHRKLHESGDLFFCCMNNVQKIHCFCGSDVQCVIEHWNTQKHINFHI